MRFLPVQAEKNPIFFMENERHRSEERETIHQEERADERHREENRFQQTHMLMLMLMMNPIEISILLHSPKQSNFISWDYASV